MNSVHNPLALYNFLFHVFTDFKKAIVIKYGVDEEMIKIQRHRLSSAVDRFTEDVNNFKKIHDSESLFPTKCLSFLFRQIVRVKFIIVVDFELEDETFPHLFGEVVYDSFIKGKVEIPYAFPHGFISKTCILPANFSPDGWNKFWKEYGNLSSLDTFRPMRDVFESLVKKIDDLEIQRVMGIDLGDPEEPGSKAFFLGNYPT